MSDQPKEVQLEISLSFAYVEGNIPTYANATLVNPSPEGVIIDFGFFDPLHANKLQKEWKGKTIEEVEEIQPIEIKSTARFVISRGLAEQLISQIQTALGTTKQ